MAHPNHPFLKLTAALIFLVGVWGCQTSDEYFAGLTTGQFQPAAEPIDADLVFAIPETELGKSTALRSDAQTMLIEHIADQLRQSASFRVKNVLPTMILPGDGHSALSLDRLRGAQKPSHVSKLIVVVASSRSAQRVQPYPLIETQLFARLDLALIDLSTGRLLLTETGQEDYLLGQRRDVERTIGYPRIYYRTQTTTGPFTVVEGDPYAELAKISFTAAADQLILRLRERLKSA